MLLESKEIESNLKEELEQVISSRNQRSEKNQYRSDNNEVNANKGNKFNIPIGNSSLGYNLNFGSSLACKTNQLSSRRNPEYEIPKNSDRTNELAFSVSSPSFGARFKYASKKQEKENLINVDIADGGLSGSSSGYRYSRGKQDYRSNDDAMARLRSQLATLPQTGGVSKFSASLYPPFTHKTEKRRVDIDDVIHEGTKGKNSSDKIFGYVDYRYLEEQNDALEPSRRGLETIYGGSDTLINKTKSNKKLYCEFAKTALNLMSVLEEGNNLVQKDDWANVPRDTELEDQVLEIKSKYCCTEP